MTSGTIPSRWRAGRVVFSLTLRVVFSLTLVGLASSTAGCGKSTDDRPATWSYVSTAILQPNCATANCHSAIAQRALVDLSTRAAGYRSLVDRHFVIARDSVLGDAGTPVLTDDERVERSQVINLMHAQGNLRMPPDMPLPETDIQLVASWIRNGAAND